MLQYVPTEDGQEETFTEMAKDRTGKEDDDQGFV
jgi:hypothetical protein